MSIRDLFSVKKQYSSDRIGDPPLTESADHCTSCQKIVMTKREDYKLLISEYHCDIISPLCCKWFVFCSNECVLKHKKDRHSKK